LCPPALSAPHAGDIVFFAPPPFFLPCEDGPGGRPPRWPVFVSNLPLLEKKPPSFLLYFSRIDFFFPSFLISTFLVNVVLPPRIQTISMFLLPFPVVRDNLHTGFGFLPFGGIFFSFFSFPLVLVVRYPPFSFVNSSVPSFPPPFFPYLCPINLKRHSDFFFFFSRWCCLLAHTRSIASANCPPFPPFFPHVVSLFTIYFPPSARRVGPGD